MSSVFKDYLPYRTSHNNNNNNRRATAAGVVMMKQSTTTMTSSPQADYYYEIRPHFHFLESRNKAGVGIHHQQQPLDAGSVTGIPQLVELDDAVFNPLDPGQLLRESAAAASRAALQVSFKKSIKQLTGSGSLRDDGFFPQDPPPAPSHPSVSGSSSQESPHSRRASSSSLVDDLLQQIYRHSDEGSSSSGSPVPGLGLFSSKCAGPLRRKGKGFMGCVSSAYMETFPIQQMARTATFVPVRIKRESSTFLIIL